MYETQKITFAEILGLGASLGWGMFLIGTVVFAMLFFRTTRGSRRHRIISTAIAGAGRLVASFCISIGLWFLWPFGFSATQSFIFLPALLSEVMTICIVYFPQRKAARKK